MEHRQADFRPALPGKAQSAARMRWAALMAGTALVVSPSLPALAAGTTAGTTITNTATVDYRVGGIDQTEVVASDSFAVDRKINLVVTRVSDPTTSVSPGETGAVIAFDVTNLSNDTIDLALAAVQASGDQFDADNVTIYVDNGNNVFDAGDTVTTLIDEIEEDATVRVFVVSDIPISRVNGDVAQLTLSATAHAGGTPGTQGAVLTSTSGANTSGVETVLADGAGASDSAGDGIYTAEGSYTVAAATLTVLKTNRVIEDPVNGASDPKAIPGALIEYCIAVSNAPGSATATDILVTDIVPADLTYEAAFGIFVGGTVDGSGNCNADGVAGGSITAATITAPVGNLPAGDTRTVYFRARID